MMLLQAVAAASAQVHPLSGTIAEWVWLLPVLPLAGFVINGLLSLNSAHFGPADPNISDHHPPEGGAEALAISHAEEAEEAGDDHHAVRRHRWAGVVSVVGPGVLILSFLLALGIWQAMATTHPEAPFIQRYFSWMPVGDLQIDAALQLDQLSMVMILVVTGVGALIHVFSVGYMRDDPGYPRYFSYLNLFVFFMLMLVLGANYPVLFVGWEGVGLCSYLLIGFWFNDKVNADAGKKAFILNRIGDFGFLVAMFMIYHATGSLSFQEVFDKAPGTFGVGGRTITLITLALFLGCTGKSAQIPLYTWLPDAMAGPTPVSAPIHAATMVTAGVYLVARCNLLFALAPVSSAVVAGVGALTALFAATIALKQWDIKKVLAYSTVSQLGYMFVGVGAGAYVSGVFHLVTHAFFKALLFLGSGSVIFAMHRAYHATHSDDDAQDMRNMGGLKRHMPWTFWLMLTASLAVAGIFPFAGFFSKDQILSAAFSLGDVHPLWYVYWLLGLLTALLTAFYMTRLMLYTFHGPNRTGKRESAHLREAPWVMTGPLVVLAALSLAGGALNVPALLRGREWLEHWLEPVTAVAARLRPGIEVPHGTEWALVIAAVAAAGLGIIAAVRLLRPEELVPARLAPAERGFARVLWKKWYVDEIYDFLFVRPLIWLSREVLWRTIDLGLIDGAGVSGAARLSRALGWIGSRLQTGQLGFYVVLFVGGVLAVLWTAVR